MRKSLIILAIVTLGVAVLFSIKEYNELQQPGIVVLLYHKISKETTCGDKYTVHINKFKEQIDYLVKEGYCTTLPKDILNSTIPYDSSKKIVLSFDDGTADHYSLVYPLLRKRGMKGVFFVVTKYIGGPGAVTASQLIEMSQNSMEIGSHSYSHPFLDELDYCEIKDELEKSKRDLENIIERKVISFAPPGGWFDENVVNVSREVGYKALFGCEIGTNDISKTAYVYKRIEVLRDTSMEKFEKVLNPPRLFKYKMVQSLKFFVHDLIGSENYRKLSFIRKLIGYLAIDGGRMIPQRDGI